MFYIICGNEILFRSVDLGKCRFYLADMPATARIVRAEDIDVSQFTFNLQ